MRRILLIAVILGALGIAVPALAACTPAPTPSSGTLNVCHWAAPSGTSVSGGGSVSHCAGTKCTKLVEVNVPRTGPVASPSPTVSAGTGSIGPIPNVCHESQCTPRYAPMPAVTVDVPRGSFVLLSVAGIPIPVVVPARVCASTADVCGPTTPSAPGIGVGRLIRIEL